MAAINAVSLRNQLAQLTNSSGIHKEQADSECFRLLPGRTWAKFVVIFLFVEYRALLEQILLNTETELVETLKIFIEASK